MNRLTCKICDKNFDLSEKLARLFPNCGHTFCSNCIKKKIIENEKNKNMNSKIICPIDKIKCEFFNKNKGLKSFPINFEIKNYLEDLRDFDKKKKEEKKNFCEEHKKKIDLICLKDNKLICYDCALFGNHKNHEFKKIENYKKEQDKIIGEYYIDIMKLENKNILKENFLEDIKNEIEKKKIYFFSILEKNVRIIKENLDKRKFEIEDDIEKEFFKILNNLIIFETDSKRVKLENYELVKKIKEIKEMDYNENFTKNLKKIEMHYKNIKLKIKKLNLGSKLLLKDDLQEIENLVKIDSIKENLIKKKKIERKISIIKNKLKRKTSKFSNHSRNLTDIKLIRFDSEFKNNLISSYSEENLDESNESKKFLDDDLFSNNNFNLNSDISEKSSIISNESKQKSLIISNESKEKNSKNNFNFEIDKIYLDNSKKDFYSKNNFNLDSSKNNFGFDGSKNNFNFEKNSKINFFRKIKK